MRIRQGLHLTGYVLCVGLKEEAQAHYFRTILAIPILV